MILTHPLSYGVRHVKVPATFIRSMVDKVKYVPRYRHPCTVHSSISSSSREYQTRLLHAVRILILSSFRWYGLEFIYTSSTIQYL